MIDLSALSREDLETVALILLLQREIAVEATGDWEASPPTPERIRAHALRHTYAPDPDDASEREDLGDAVGLWMVRTSTGHGLVRLGFARSGEPWAWSEHLPAFHSEGPLAKVARDACAWLPLTAKGGPAR